MARSAPIHSLVQSVALRHLPLRWGLLRVPVHRDGLVNYQLTQERMYVVRQCQVSTSYGLHVIRIELQGVCPPLGINVCPTRIHNQALCRPAVEGNHILEAKRCELGHCG